MKGYEHGELYSLYDHWDDIYYETDIETLRQEVIRQRLYIDKQQYEVNKLAAEVTLLRGMRMVGNNGQRADYQRRYMDSN